MIQPVVVFAPFIRYGPCHSIVKCDGNSDCGVRFGKLVQDAILGENESWSSATIEVATYQLFIVRRSNVIKKLQPLSHGKIPLICPFHALRKDKNIFQGEASSST